MFRVKNIDMKPFVLIIFLCSSLLAQTFQSVVQRLEQIPVGQRQSLIERYLSTKRIAPIIEHDSLLHFVLYGIADSVFVNGNLQYWNEPARMEKLPCGPYSLFHRSFVVPPDARLDYQLIINGVYKLDPQNPYITPSGFGPHSEVRMPKFKPSPYLRVRNDVTHGTIDSLAPLMDIPSPLRRYLPSTRPIKVYRPSGYDAFSNLPTVYIHDGFEAIDFAHVPTIIDNLIAEKKIPPIIAVFIPPVEREDEYSGKKSGQYVKMVCDELVPLIDKIYSTDPSPSKRAMMGISSGGHITLFTVMNRPDVFQNAGAQSSLITQELTDLTKKRAGDNSISVIQKIYIDCGRFDIKTENTATGPFDLLDLNRQYSELLSSLRIPHRYLELNDGHEWANWRERMPEMLMYFFGQPY